MRAGHHEPAHVGGADFLVVADRGRCRPVACSCPSEPRGVRRARAARAGPGAAAQPRAAHAPVKREPAWHMLPPPARAGASVHRGSGPGDRIYPTKSGRRGRMVSRHQGSRSYGSAGGLGHRHGCNARVVAIEEKPRFLVAGFQNLCSSTDRVSSQQEPNTNVLAADGSLVKNSQLWVLQFIFSRTRSTRPFFCAAQLIP